MVDFSKFPTPAERAAERAARPLRVVFTGARDWTFLAPVQATIRRLATAGCRRVAHGAARGLDALVDAEARSDPEGLHVERYPADWSQGRAAGIPDPTKAWALLQPLSDLDRPEDPRTRAALDALLA